MKLNRCGRGRRDSGTGAANGGSLSELPAEVQACNGDKLRELPADLEAGNRDRLSELPADLLLNILERVGTLDAVKTCILSKKMQKLPTMLSQIVIDLSTDDLVRIHTVVANVTNKILNARSSKITIRKLKLKFFLSPSHCLSIGKCVGLAMADQKVDSAEFEILTPRNGHLCTETYRLLFAQQFNDFFRDCPDAFAGLTGLHLQYMRFGESDITNILSYCKQLESLSLFMCDEGVSSVMRVEHARLVELVISHCEFKTVELTFLPKLQRMTFNSWPSCAEHPLALGFVPELLKLSLAKACFSHKTLKLSQLLANVLSVNDLSLEFRSEKIWIRPESPKVLSPWLAKLRFVNLDNLPEECDIAWTMFLLEAAPFVVEFCIMVWDHKCHMESQKSYSEKTDVKWEPSDPDFKHKNLAKLTIYGFQSDDNFTGHIRRVMAAAVNIKEVSLHDRKVCKVCAVKFPHVEVRPSSYPRTSDEKDLLRNKITETLSKASPAVIHFCS
ncbi:uncharacterized protein LOC119318564 [Triticum dicoccoides]|uniref:uncharacterized protein LOC119318564 n=1 Tax=Triticum dicoccoides TaxID=85692 RepID=UPI000E7BE43C|nr:uncharacterized protein LOC119318564 [Triticum dicoccoides]